MDFSFSPLDYYTQNSQINGGHFPQLTKSDNKIFVVYVKRADDNFFVTREIDVSSYPPTYSTPEQIGNWGNPSYGHYSEEVSTRANISHVLSGIDNYLFLSAHMTYVNGSALGIDTKFKLRINNNNWGDAQVIAWD
jgi:hypothetical protein